MAKQTPSQSIRKKNIRKNRDCRARRPTVVQGNNLGILAQVTETMYLMKIPERQENWLIRNTERKHDNKHGEKIPETLQGVAELGRREEASPSDRKDTDIRLGIEKNVHLDLLRYLPNKNRNSI